jgi:glutamate racemase
MMNAPIGIFDSGYGGLTVFRDIEARLPEYDFVYLGDNARTPYGPRSFATVYAYTWQAVSWLFARGCPLVIVACNTASAKALRSIQQRDLPASADPTRRVLGVIRPTAEVIGRHTRTGKVGILGTSGTVKSESYRLEIARFWPDLTVVQQACPLWVPLVEAGELQGPGTDHFVRLYLDRLFAQEPGVDTILLACTHYPLLMPTLQRQLAPQVAVVAQGAIVAESLADYLQRRPEMAGRLSRDGSRVFYTTDEPAEFEEQATLFLGRTVAAEPAALIVP